MADRPSLSPFDTVAAAEILLAQDQLGPAREMTERLAAARPDDDRVAALHERVEARTASGPIVQLSARERGLDRVSLRAAESGVDAEFELTDAGLAVARRTAVYSGASVLRLFTVVAGPRGVRKRTRDIELERRCGRLRVVGTPRPAVHVAAVGHLARSGVFVPVATSAPLEVPA